MQIKPDEITSILKSRIEGLDAGQAGGREGVLQRRAVLQLEGGVEALDRLLLVELLF